MPDPFADIDAQLATLTGGGPGDQAPNGGGVDWSALDRDLEQAAITQEAAATRKAAGVAQQVRQRAPDAFGAADLADVFNVARANAVREQGGIPLPVLPQGPTMAGTPHERASLHVLKGTADLGKGVTRLLGLGDTPGLGQDQALNEFDTADILRDLPQARGVGEQVLDSAAESLPSLLLGLGVGRAVAPLAAGLGPTAQTYATLGATGAGAALPGAPEEYDQGIQAGMSPLAAAVNAAGMVGIEGLGTAIAGRAGERFLGAQGLERLVMPAAQRIAAAEGIPLGEAALKALRALAAGTVQEGGEESFIQAQHAARQKLTNRPDLTPERALKEIGIAGLTGAAMGGPGEVAGSVAEHLAPPQADPQAAELERLARLWAGVPDGADPGATIRPDTLEPQALARRAPPAAPADLATSAVPTPPTVPGTDPGEAPTVPEGLAAADTAIADPVEALPETQHTDLDPGQYGEEMDQDAAARAAAVASEGQPAPQQVAEKSRRAQADALAELVDQRHAERIAELVRRRKAGEIGKPQAAAEKRSIDALREREMADAQQAVAEGRHWTPPPAVAPSTPSTPAAPAAPTAPAEPTPNQNQNAAAPAPAGQPAASPAPTPTRTAHIVPRAGGGYAVALPGSGPLRFLHPTDAPTAPAEAHRFATVEEAQQAAAARLGSRWAVNISPKAKAQQETAATKARLDAEESARMEKQQQAAVADVETMRQRAREIAGRSGGLVTVPDLIRASPDFGLAVDASHARSLPQEARARGERLMATLRSRGLDLKKIAEEASRGPQPAPSSVPAPAARPVAPVASRSTAPGADAQTAAAHGGEAQAEPAAPAVPSPAVAVAEDRTPQYGDMVSTPDGQVGFMRGAGSLGSDRVAVIGTDGSKSYHNLAELKLISRQKVHNQPTPEADAIIEEAKRIQEERDRTFAERSRAEVARRMEAHRATQAKPASDTAAEREAIQDESAGGQTKVAAPVGDVPFSQERNFEAHAWHRTQDEARALAAGDEPIVIAATTAKTVRETIAALNAAITQHRGKAYTNRDSGVEIEVSGKGISHAEATATRSAEIAALTELDQIIESARASKPEPSTKAHVADALKLFAPIRVGTATMVVKVTALRHRLDNKARFYDLSSVELLTETKEPQPRDGLGRDAEALPRPTSAGATGILPQDESAGKRPENGAPDGTQAQGERDLSQSAAQERQAFTQAQAGRLPVAPPPNGATAPKTIRALAEKLGDWLGSTTYAPAPMPRRAAGYYDPASGAQVIRRSTDLDVIAHETGHFLDDRFAILGPYQSMDVYANDPEGVAAADAHNALAATFDPELRHFWPYGSSPRAGMSPAQSMNYRRAEGAAEYLRAWMVNPEAAEAAAPAFTARVKATVPAEVLAKLREFGDGVRAFTHGDPLKTGNIQSIGDTGPTLAGRIREGLSRDRSLAGDPLTFGVRDWLRLRFTDRLAPLMKAVRWAGQQVPGGDARARRAELLVRLLGGVNDKTAAIARGGMIRHAWLKDGKVQRAEGVEGGVDWILEPADHRSQEAMQQDIDALGHYMVSQRVLEREQQAESERQAKVAELLEKANQVHADELAVLDGSVTLHPDGTATKVPGLADRWRGEAKRQGEAIERHLVGRITKARDKADTAIEGGDKDLAKEIDRQPRKADQKRLTAARDRLGRRGAALDTAISDLFDGMDRGTGRLSADAEKKVKRLRQQIEARHLNRLGAIARFNARKARADAQALSRMTGEGGGVVSDLERAKQTVERVRRDPVVRARLDEMAKRYRATANGVLRYLVDAGRLSEEQFRAITEKNQQYVAMHRLREDGIAAFRPAGGGKLGSAKDVVQGFTGSTREIHNPLVNLMDGMQRAVAEADRNTAMRSVVDLLRESRGMYGGEANDLGSVAVKLKEKAPGSVTVYRNGEEEHWQFAPEIAEAIKGLSEQYRVPLLLSGPASLVRWGVTHSPDFAIRNRIRDITNRLIIGKVKPQTAVGWAKHLAKQVPGSQRYSDEQRTIIELAGGAFAGHYLRSKQHWQQELVKRTKELREDRNVVVAGLSALPRAYVRLIENSEFAGRASEFMGVFQQLKAQGMDEMTAALEAAGAARELTDFAVSGTWIGTASQVVPFLNAAVQGARATINAARQRPGEFALRWSLFSLLPSLAVYGLAAAGGDEEREEYENLPSWRRDLYWNIKIAPNTWLAIPKPFEVGALGTTGERVVQAAAGASRGDPDAVKKAFSGHAGSIAGALSPVDTGSLMVAYKPLVEVLLNRDSFGGRAIVPDYEAKLPVEQRKGAEHASRLGLAGSALSGGTVDPRQVDHLVRGFFGSLGGIALSGSDVAREDKAGGATALAMRASGLLKTGAGSRQASVEEFLAEEAQQGRPQAKPAKAIAEMSRAYWKAATGAERDAIAKAMRDYAEGRDPLMALDRAAAAGNALQKAMKDLEPEARRAFVAANRQALAQAAQLDRIEALLGKMKKAGKSRAEIQAKAVALMKEMGPVTIGKPQAAR